MRENLTQDYQTLADCHTEEMAQLLEDFGESQEEVFRQLCDIGSEHQRAEEARKSEAIILPDSDSVAQHESPYEQDAALEVTTLAAPIIMSHDPVVAANEPLQRDPYQTPIGVDEELQTEPPVETL